MRAIAGLLAAAVLGACVAPRCTAAFSFGEEDQRDKESAERVQAKRRSEAAPLSAACRAELAKRRTVVVVAERTSHGLHTDQSAYGGHFGALNRALRNFGVRTYTQEEIRAQIAQAEVDAYFQNDPDAALAASRKLGADLVLRGTISSRSTYNEFMHLPEVAVSISLELADASGRVRSEAGASADSYSGSDTVGMALRLLNEQAPGVVGRLLREYCRGAGSADKDTDRP